MAGNEQLTPNQKNWIEYKKSFNKIATAKVSTNYNKYENQRIKIELKEGCTIEEARDALKAYESLLNEIEAHILKKSGYGKQISERRDQSHRIGNGEGSGFLQNT